MNSKHITIVGGGFSGTMLLIQMMRQCQHPLSITLINAHYPLAKGIAYSTDSDQHLLNVRAGRMSALPEEPLHFVQWINAQSDAQSKAWHVPDLAERFVPRNLYGRYIEDLLASQLNEIPPHLKVEIIADEVKDLIENPSGFTVQLTSGKAFQSDRVVLTIGHTASHSLPCKETPHDDPGITLNPWNNELGKLAHPQNSIMIIGAGLTMADTVLSLLDHGHRGPIHVVSRHGVLPLTHPTQRPEHHDLPELPAGADLGSLYRQLKLRIKKNIDGDTWHEPVLDALRPHTQTLWQQFSVEEKKRFVRHIAHRWQRLRHRLPMEIYAILDEAIERGQLSLFAGNLLSVNRNGSKLNVQFHDRRQNKLSELQVAHIINCTGPETDLSKNGSPLINSLMERGTIRPCALRLGFDAQADGRLINASGSTHLRLYTMGPGLRGVLWESVAVPELRVQAKSLAQELSK